MTNRDYSNFDLYYQELLSDIYPQPMDAVHLKSMIEIIARWVAPLGIGSVLDVGCGEGDSERIFEYYNIRYWGIAIGEIKPITAKMSVADFNFLKSENVAYDLIFSRHSLEHSPFPLITLMEWHRVSAKWLCLVLPNPEHYTYVGRNHYSVMGARQAAWILRRAGWKMRKFYMDKEEIWFLCEKMPRISYEGWAKVPLSREIYEFERDMLQYGEVDVTKYIK